MIEEGFFQNPESLAIAVALLIFIMSFVVLRKVTKMEKGVLLVISFVISVGVAWQLYKQRFYGWEGSLAVILVVIVIVLFVMILLAFIKFIRRNFGR